VLTKKVWERIKRIAILKQLPTHFKEKREKGAGTPFPRVPAPLHPCLLFHTHLHNTAWRLYRHPTKITGSILVFLMYFLFHFCACVTPFFGMDLCLFFQIPKLSFACTSASSVAILRGDLSGSCPLDFWLAPSFMLNFTFKFVWLTYTADNLQPAIF